MNHCMQQMGLWKPKWSYKRKTLCTSSFTIQWVQVLVVMSLEHEGTTCLCLMLKSVKWSYVCYQYFYVCNLLLCIFNVGAWSGREATICPS